MEKEGNWPGVPSSFGIFVPNSNETFAWGSHDVVGLGGWEQTLS